MWICPYENTCALKQRRFAKWFVICSPECEENIRRSKEAFKNVAQNNSKLAKELARDVAYNSNLLAED